jgi:hypothetical protein
MRRSNGLHILPHASTARAHIGRNRKAANLGARPAGAGVDRRSVTLFEGGLERVREHRFVTTAQEADRPAPARGRDGGSRASGRLPGQLSPQRSGALAGRKLNCSMDTVVSPVVAS